MIEKLKPLFVARQPWQVVLLATAGAVLITDLVTALISFVLWREVRFDLMVLGTVNAILVPVALMPAILRMLRQVIQLEEQNQAHREAIARYEQQNQVDAALTRRADEMSLLYQLGLSLASGRDLSTTLTALHTEILKLIRVDAFFVAIYDEATDLVEYPIYFARGRLQPSAARRLSAAPGLTGAVLYGRETLYLPNIMEREIQARYAPVTDGDLIMHTFLGIPLTVNEKVIGVLSVQSDLPDAYSRDQVRLMENVAVQAALAIHKARLLDQVQQDLAEKSRMENQVRDREVILEAVAFAAEQFLKAPDWRDVINAVLERLGKTLNVTHAYLFEDHLNSQGEPVTSMRYEWTAPGYPSDLDSPYFKNSPVYQEGYIEQVETLKQGEARIGNSSTFNPIEKEAMDSLGVKAILEVPIFLDDREWGAIGFDDFERERVWSRGEVEALKIAAGVLGAAIQQKEAESAVHEAERIYRQAIEAAGAVPYYRDYRANRYTFMGAEIEKIIGYKPDEVTSELWLDIVKENIPLGEGQGLSIEEAVRQSRTGGLKTWKSDVRVIARNGETRWLTDSAVELFDEADTSYATVGILQDITHRKQTEADLRKRESTLAAITFAAEQFLKAADWRDRIDLVLERIGWEFNASHVYLFEKHPDAQGRRLTSMICEWTAPDCETDLGKPDYQNLPPNHTGFTRLYEILDQGEPLIGGTSFFNAAEREYFESVGVRALLEMRVVVGGGHWGTLGVDETRAAREWTPMEVNVLRVAANLLGAAIKRQLDEAALQKELDERQKLIAELEMRNAESETLRESVALVAGTLEQAEAVDRILEQLARVVPYDSASVQLLTGDMLEIVSFRGPERKRNDVGMRFPVNDLEPSYPVIRGQQPYILYEDVQTSTSVFTEAPHNDIHAWLAVPLKAKGTIKGVIALDGLRAGQFSERDATLAVTYANQVAIALENARLFSELQEELAERKKLISELENKNGELERFTYTVSHDLKSPLVTINGFLGYLEQDALSGNTERLRRDLQRISEAVMKMQNLLNELLELSRIGRVVNTSESVPFADLAREALSLVAGRLETRGVTVEVSPDLPTVRVDRPRLVEVLQNLLDNAAKYMGGQARPHIEIGQRGEDEGRGESVFYVKDNGMGIAPEYHERIFGLFNKLDPKSEGTGVGLALVRRIVEIHGGRVWVESEAGHGATFLFTLPQN